MRSAATLLTSRVLSRFRLQILATLGFLLVAGGLSKPIYAQDGPNPLQVALFRWYGANTAVQVQAGQDPRALGFDGSNIWVANYGAATVTKIRANDGANLGYFQVGNNPSAIAFDGANIWVALYGSNSVVELRASDGVNEGSVTVGTQPTALAFDGANIWVANYGSANISKIQVSNR
jgi:hypothetical protein